MNWRSLAAGAALCAVVAVGAAVAGSSRASADHEGTSHPDVAVQLDLNDGTLFHDEPTFVHPTDPPESPNGEIEDNYFSPTMRFTPFVLNDIDGMRTARIRVDFVDASTGRPQKLRIDAEGTGWPFPETFAIRFPGVPDHDTLGPGMFFYGPGGGVRAIADGGLEVTLLDAAYGEGDVALSSPYPSSFRCFIDDCTSGPHFFEGKDLTDQLVTFSGFIVDLTLENFDRCSLSRPDCGGVNIDGFGFGLLGGDIEIIQVVDLDFDLETGTLAARPGTAEDSYRSGPIPVGPVELDPDQRKVELRIRFVDGDDGSPQLLELGALGTGAPTPETFASRLPTDPCFDDGLPDGTTPCSHVFGPGMVVSNSTGDMGDAFTLMKSTVELLGPAGEYASDFANPYYEPGDDLFVLCGHGPDNVCQTGDHFPDLVDGTDRASFQGLRVGLEFASTVGTTPTIQFDTFEFNLLAGLIAPGIAPTPLSLPIMTFESGNSVHYDADSDLFVVDALPEAIQLEVGGALFPISPVAGGAESFTLQAVVDEGGRLVGGVPGDDLVIKGAVDLGALGAFSGTLLVGEVSAFSASTTGPSSSQYLLNVQPTGGLLQFLFDDPSIRLVVISDESTFANDFEVDFEGTAAGSAGTVTPNAAPIAVTPSTVTVECADANGTLVHLDGTGSFDPDGQIVDYEWTGPFGSAAGAETAVVLPFGVHSITLTVTDDGGAADSTTATVSVVDSSPPSGAVSVSPDVLWPPNNKLVPIDVTVMAEDGCDPEPAAELVSVESSEAPGRRGPDIVIVSDDELLLRASRYGTGNGRVYTITYTMIDAAGNTTEAIAEVTVPKSQGG